MDAAARRLAQCAPGSVWMRRPGVQQTVPCPPGALKPGKPGPGRPVGSGNRAPAARLDVGKNLNRVVPAGSGKKIRG